MDPRDIGLFDLVRSGWFDKDSGELTEHFPVGPGDTVADIGCGDGGFSAYCAGRGASVIFTDIREDRVRALEAQLAGKGNVRGVVSDSTPLHLEDELASRVLCTEVLEHVADPPAVMAELVRIGKPGALYLLSVPDPAGEALLATVAPGFYFQHPNHIRIFEREAIDCLVTDAGLEIVHKSYSGFFWTMGISLIWALDKGKDPQSDETYGELGPPYHEAVRRWARLWWELVQIPGFDPVRRTLNDLLPKAQIIVARKPSLERA